VVLNLELLTFGPIGPLIWTLDQTLGLGTRFKLQTLLNSTLFGRVEGVLKRVFGFDPAN
jgi:hypothetical protein